MSQIDPDGLDCVYASSTGVSVSSFDDEASCGFYGGSWYQGTLPWNVSFSLVDAQNGIAVSMNLPDGDPNFSLDDETITQIPVRSYPLLQLGGCNPGANIVCAQIYENYQYQQAPTLSQWASMQNTPVSGPWRYGSYCGPGGMGTPADALDAACQQHDYCYFMAGGLSATSNFTAGTNPAIQGCNQALCDAAIASMGPNAGQRNVTAFQVVEYFSYAPRAEYACRE